MQFKKYHSIENTTNKKFIDYILSEKLDQGEFIVQEKAHGANLSFWYDGNTLLSGKRNSIIDNDDFYDYKKIENKCRDHVIDLYQQLKNGGFQFDTLAIYGEYIGGTYPHQDIPKDSSATRIQKGIFYAPGNEFYAIDMAIDGTLFDIDAFNSSMEKTQFLFAKTLFRGTFQDCLAYPNKFISKIPEWLGLPEIKDNICEGVVIKPVKPIFLPNNDRLILKNKNEKWAEKARQKKHVKKPEKRSDALLQLQATIEQYVTENRLRNVISKIGTINQNEFGKLMCDFSQDALKDFMKDHEEAFNQLEKKEQKLLSKQLNHFCSNLIRPNFINIVNDYY